MTVPGRTCVPLLLLALCLALAAPRSAQAGRTDDMVFFGWMAAGLGSVPLHTFSLVTLASKESAWSAEDWAFCNALLVPLAGPAIAGTMLVESHPLTVLVCVAMWGMSALQTVGTIVALAGHARYAGIGRRDAPRPPRRWALMPALSPGGIGIVGVF